MKKIAALVIAFMLFASMLLNSIRRLVEFTEQFQRGMTGIERFCEIMDVCRCNAFGVSEHHHANLSFAIDNDRGTKRSNSANVPQLI